MRKKTYIYFVTLMIGLLFTACGRSGKADTNTQVPSYDWKSNGFVLQSPDANGPQGSAASAEENHLFSVDYQPIDWSLPEHVAYRTNACFRVLESTFYVFDDFRTDQNTYRSSLQKIRARENCSEVMEFSSLTWGISGGNIQTMDVLDEEHYVFWVTTEPEEDEEGRTEVKHYYAIYTDAQGNEQRRVDIIDTMREQGIWKRWKTMTSYTGSDICSDSVGNMYIRDWENKAVYWLNPDGEMLTSYKYQSTVDNSGGSIRTEGGDVIIACAVDRTIEFLWMDPESREVKKLAAPDKFDMVWNWYGLWGDTLYYATRSQIIGWNVATGEKKVLFKMAENEILNADKTSFVKLPEGEHLLVTEEERSHAERRYVLNLSSEKPEINSTLQVVNISGRNDFLKGRVITFSREHPLYGVEYVESYEEADATRVIMEMAIGKGPAIAYIPREDLENLQANSALADLKQILSEETLEALIPGAVAMGTSGGTLAGIPVTISYVQTLLVNNQYWSGTGWEISDILKIMKDHPETGLPLTDDSGYIRNLFNLLYYDLENSSFIADGKCSFNSPEFQELLKTVKEKSTNEERPLYLSELITWINEGRYMATDGVFFNLLEFCLQRQQWNEHLHVVGYPSAAGSGSYLNENGILVVNQNAAEKEEVRQLVNYLLSLESQQRIEDQISVRLDAAMLRVKYDIYFESYVWMNNDGGETLLSKEVDESYLEEYKRMLSTAVPPPTSSRELFNIIEEEAEPYFYSDKSLEVVCDAIQRRVQLYLDERN